MKLKIWRLFYKFENGNSGRGRGKWTRAVGEKGEHSGVPDVGGARARAEE